jgi:hypothetical protein
LKIYVSTIEGLLLNNPAAILHKDQKLRVEHDTVEVLTAVTEGKLVLAEDHVSAPEQASVSEQIDREKADKERQKPGTGRSGKTDKPR